jgi:hypothetical protein
VNVTGGRVDFNGRRYRIDAERIRRHYEGARISIRPLSVVQVEVWSNDGTSYLSRATLDEERQ